MPISAARTSSFTYAGDRRSSWGSTGWAAASGMGLRPCCRRARVRSSSRSGDDLRRRAAHPGPMPGDATRPADVFVAFGISGDLAKVMTFRSLYRLEARGLLDCPIVGVAVDDWTADDLRDHARAAIEGSGDGSLDEAVF